MTLTYGAADSGWLLASAGHTALLFRHDGGVSPAEVWGAIQSSSAIQSVLDVLTRGGLTAAPAFALAEWASDGRVLALVRGEATIVAAGVTDDTRLDGTAMSTWQEKTLEGVTSITLSAPDAPVASYPLVAGIVRAGSCAISVTEAVLEPAAKSPVAPPVAKPAVVEPAVKPVVQVEANLAAVPEATITELPESMSVEASIASAPEHAAAPTSGYAALFEETMVRTIEDAAVRPIEPSDDEPEAAAGSTAAPFDRGPGEPDDELEELAGDHDGMTVMSGDLAELRRSRAATPGPATTTPTTASAIPAARSLFLELSTGGRELLSQPILVGRSPSVSKVSSGRVPRLVTIPGDQDISRNHAQFQVEGDTVVVTDLHSRNGTSVILPGKSAQVLRPGEPTAVIPGTIVDLGGGVTLSVVEGE